MCKNPVAVASVHPQFRCDGKPRGADLHPSANLLHHLLSLLPLVPEELQSLRLSAISESSSPISTPKGNQVLKTWLDSFLPSHIKEDEHRNGCRNLISL